MDQSSEERWWKPRRGSDRSGLRPSGLRGVGGADGELQPPDGIKPAVGTSAESHVPSSSPAASLFFSNSPLHACCSSSLSQNDPRSFIVHPHLFDGNRRGGRVGGGDGESCLRLQQLSCLSGKGGLSAGICTGSATYPPFSILHRHGHLTIRRRRGFGDKRPRGAVT
ncbi:unnamed protein product [Pleuronectes platessa]|uniref:Uncharacterized protein n=1 Tax=Pleuronectes platessa TaxID=8262 RepID=A0A9N7VXM3_PLEPL|nr:unnamed protein product [Pleuronectes platessa]